MPYPWYLVRQPISVSCSSLQRGLIALGTGSHVMAPMMRAFAVSEPSGFCGFSSRSSTSSISGSASPSSSSSSSSSSSLSLSSSASLSEKEEVPESESETSRVPGPPGASSSSATPSCLARAERTKSSVSVRSARMMPSMCERPSEGRTWR